MVERSDILWGLWDTMNHRGFPQLDTPREQRGGWCYALALRQFIEKPYPGQELAHGFPRLEGYRELYGHAWIEIDRVVVWDPVLDSAFPADLYYREGAIDPSAITRWSSREDVLEAFLEAECVHNWAPVDCLPEEPIFDYEGLERARANGEIR